MIAFRLVSGVSTHFITRLPEWANTIILINFGLTLLAPSVIFTQPAFSVMAHYASEDVWGWALLSIGSFRLFALVLNGTFEWFAPWSMRIRALSASLSCFAWFCISLGLFLGGPENPGWKTYGAHLVIDIILAIHLGAQAGKVDRGIWSNGRG